MVKSKLECVAVQIPQVLCATVLEKKIYVIKQRVDYEKESQSLRKTAWMGVQTSQFTDVTAAL